MVDFSYSETQKIFLNSANRFLEKEAKNLFRKVEKTYEGYSVEVWQKMANLGWLGMVFPEEYGGIDGNFLDLVLLIEEMGKHLFPGPFISTVISGLSILRYGNELQKDEFLPGLIEGKLIISPALTQPDTSAGKEEKIRVKDGYYVVSGMRLFVPFAHMAHFFLYGVDVRDKDKALFLIDARNSGIAYTPLDSIGGNKPCELVLKEVKVSETNLLGGQGNGLEIIREMNDWGALLESAYILGMLEQVLKMTIRHAKEREQFGRKIGSFQAIQHQIADMKTNIDQVKFLTYEAAWKVSQNVGARKEISMAKAWASDAARRVCLLGVKIHGGMGVCEEHDMQLYFRRAKSCEVLYGDGDFHREIVAHELGL